MKRSLGIVMLLFLTSCGLQQMNENMQKSNENIQENTTTIQRSSDEIHNNTQAVLQSTKTLQESKEVIAGNTAFLEKAMNQMNARPYLLPVIFILILLALFFPSFFLYLAYRSLFRKMEPLLERIKRNPPP